MKTPKEIRHEAQLLWYELRDVKDRMDLLRKECPHANVSCNEIEGSLESCEEKYCDDCGAYLGQQNENP